MSVFFLYKFVRVNLSKGNKKTTTAQIVALSGLSLNDLIPPIHVSLGLINGVSVVETDPHAHFERTADQRAMGAHRVGAGGGCSFSLTTLSRTCVASQSGMHQSHAH